MNIILKQFIEIMTVMYSGHFGDWYNFEKPTKDKNANRREKKK